MRNFLKKLKESVNTNFVTQKGVGFYVGDEDLTRLFNRWLRKKYFEQGRKGCAPLPGPKLKDLFELGS